MKTGNFSKIALLGGALVIPAYADKVQLQQLPQNVQDRIRNQIGSAEINDIDRDVRNGTVRYEVGYKGPDGQQKEAVFKEQAPLSSSSASSGSTQLDSRKLRKEELPVQVRRVVNSRLANMEINDIEREVKNGQVTYGIGYKQSGGVGPQQELVLSENGSILRSSAGGSDSVASSPTYSPPVYSIPSTSTTGVSTQTISYNEVPEAVRRTASANLTRGDVKRVERQVQNGEVNYQIDFQKEDGQHQQMLIAQDGRIIRNQMISSLSSPDGSSTSQSISYNDVPEPVRRVAAANMSHGDVKHVERQTLNGEVDYQIDFQKDNGDYQQMVIAQDGRIVRNQTIQGSAYGGPGAAQSGTSSSVSTNNGNIFNRIGRALFDQQ